MLLTDIASTGCSLKILKLLQDLIIPNKKLSRQGMMLVIEKSSSTMENIQNLLQEALSLCQSGQINKGEKIYLQRVTFQILIRLCHLPHLLCLHRL